MPSSDTQTQPEGVSSADLDRAIGLLRARIDEEFRITERLDTKVRQVFAAAAGFFVIAQTVAGAALGDAGLDGAEELIVGISAVLAIVAFAGAAIWLADSEELLEEEDMQPDVIVAWCDEAEDPDHVALHAISPLRDVAKRRSENNAIRARNSDRVNAAARFVVIVSTVELLVAFVMRVAT